MFCTRVWLQAHNLITTFSSIQQLHRVHGEKSEERFQQNRQFCPAKALLQLRDTPLADDLPSPAEILHGQLAQGAVGPQHTRPVNIKWVCQKLIERQDKQKQNFDKAHRASDLWPLKVQEQVRFFPNNQPGAPVKWLTGTVTKVLDCDRSYMIEGPNWWVYRRDRTHLKPICYDNTPYPDPKKAEKDQQQRNNSFQDPSRPKSRKTVTFKSGTTASRSRSHDDPIVYPHLPVRHPSTSPLTSTSPSTSLHQTSRESLVEHYPKDSTSRRRQISFIRPRDVDTRQTPGLSTLLQEISPLAPYKRERSAKTKAQKAFTHRCWILSRPL